jgi:hypothetical protein
MAEIDDEIAAIKAAIGQGARKVVFVSGGTRREIEYHSLTDMRDYLASLEAKKGARRRVTLASF